MISAKQRIKLSQSANLKNENISSAANTTDSAYISQADSTPDLSTHLLRRKGLASSQASKLSFNSTEHSSGFQSLLSSSSSLIRSPKKRKHEVTDENASQNSSPRKRHKRDERGDKRILKEKSSSENVIFNSTPIRDNKKSKFSRFRSLHSDKLVIGKHIEDFQLPAAVAEEESFVSPNSFDFTGSFAHDEDTSSIPNFPNSFHKLLCGQIKTPETVTKSEESLKDLSGISSLTTTPQDSLIAQSSSNLSSASSVRSRFYGGRSQVDILNKLHQQKIPPLDQILSYLNGKEILSLSHVSKDYQKMIKSHKTSEAKKQNYLKQYQKVRENVPPGEAPIMIAKVDKKEKRRNFTELNVNHSMQLRPKPVSPPVSPSKKRFQQNQNVVKSHCGPIRKCPRCFNSAIVINKKIRCSPRKHKKSNLMKLSSTFGGRVQKRNSKSFLAKPSIDSQLMSEQLYSTLPTFDEHSASDSSYTMTSSAPSSDESSGNETHDFRIYEYAECQGLSCCFKFCFKCNSKYHPHQVCTEISPPSPQRSYRSNISIPCTDNRASNKSLKRLLY